MKKILLLIGFGLLIFSCKKDKLTDDKSIFVGKWNWAYTSHAFGWCDDESYGEIITPDTDGNNYSIEFLEKGIVKYYENGNYLDKDRLVFLIFGEDCGYAENSISFGVYLNNKLYEEEFLFQGCVGSDTLILTRGFPYSTYQVGCESYVSYFARE